MKNSEIEAAWGYHNSTKHSYESVRTSRHYLDWENQPKPFKVYSNLKAVPLPEHLSSSETTALLALSASGAERDHHNAVSSQSLAEILYLSAGITKRRKYPVGEILFRAAACTGALYHVDLYIVSGDLEGLQAGVYQFSPQDFSLRRLRAGDYRSVLVKASGGEPAIATAPCIIVSASTFWRNAWKYQSRTYRHCYWDNGTILANLLAAAAARKIPAKLVMGYVDEIVNRLLALDRQREAPLSLVALGDFSPQPSGSPPLELLVLETEPLSKSEVDYPPIREMHEASSLETAEEVATWHKAAERPRHQSAKDETAQARLIPLESLDDPALPRDTLEEVILRRGSTREFARESISFAQLSTVLDRATRGIHADLLTSPAESLNDLYLIVHAVDDLAAGAYVLRRDKRALELLKEGDFRRQAGYLGLGQAIPADCSVNVYFLTDLRNILERFGNRGYRAAQIEAAIMGGKVYLAAYAQRLGASGLTFFDDDVTAFFSPHAAGKSVMFLVALGKSARQKKE